MKKVLMFVLLVSFVVSISVGCGGNQVDPTTPKSFSGAGAEGSEGGE